LLEFEKKPKVKIRMFSYNEAKAKASTMKFNTLKEYSKWVVDNHYEALFPVNPRTFYKDFECGAKFLGWTQEEYQAHVTKARKASTDYKALGQKVSATFERKRSLSVANIERNRSLSLTEETPVNKEASITAEEMVKFFIKEDVDIKVIINFLSEYSHPKDVYQIFLDYLKNKYSTVKI
jgi:hypothetical protein